MAPTSTPSLMALAHGLECSGLHQCFYCRASCGDTYSVAEYVKSSFTGRPMVGAPGSAYVCPGCVLCLREGCDLMQINGVPRYVNVGAMRAFSWVVTKERALAASKAHIAELRAVCLNPPDPPYSLVISESGQTHQLYRGKVCHHAGDPVILTLEGEPIEYRVADLRSRLDLCGRLAAATGKPALSEPISSRMAMAVSQRYSDWESLVSTWSRVREEPLSRLAVFLCPNKESCLELYPGDIASTAPEAGHGGASKETGGAGGPAEASGQRRGKRGLSGDGQRLLFAPLPGLPA